MARAVDEVCPRCGDIHFRVETEVDGDLVHFQLVVTKCPCTVPLARVRPRLADMVAVALVGEAAA